MLYIDFGDKNVNPLEKIKRGLLDIRVVVAVIVEAIQTHYA